MSLWCMLNAPLLSSCDLRSMNEPTKNILLNPEIIAISQDEKGEQARLIQTKNGVQVYLKHLADSSVAVAIFNTKKSEANFDLKAEGELAGTWNARDVWQHKETGVLKDKITLALKPHETIVLKLAPSHF
jgi:alpha-galactosidase